MTVANDPGPPSRVTLLNGSSKGEKYELPGEVYNRLRNRRGDDAAKRDR